MGCYAMALQAGKGAAISGGGGATAAAQPLVVARLLRALRMNTASSSSAAASSGADSSSMTTTSKADSTTFNLEAHAKFLPASTWLAWIPFLLSSLQSGHGDEEASTAANFLAKVGQKYPQALYYPLRSFLLEEQAKASTVAESDCANPTEGTAAGTAMEVDVPILTDPSTTSSSPALKHASALMSMLRRYHGDLMQTLDELCCALEEGGTATASTSDEASLALLVALDALLQKCYADTHVLDTEPLPSAMAQEIVNMYEHSFAANENLSALKVAFEMDFSIGGGAVNAGSGTFGETLQQLNKWRHAIKSRVLSSTSRQVPLAQVILCALVQEDILFWFYFQHCRNA